MKWFSEGEKLGRKAVGSTTLWEGLYLNTSEAEKIAFLKINLTPLKNVRAT